LEASLGDRVEFWSSLFLGVLWLAVLREELALRGLIENESFCPPILVVKIAYIIHVRASITLFCRIELP
jgi:hypothetical protein